MSNSTFGFIVSSCIIGIDHLLALKKCIESIRKNHDNTIVLVVSYSSTIKDFQPYLTNYKNIIVETYEENTPGDMKVYDFFLKNKYFDKAIFLHDSMSINEPFTDINTISDVKYLWHFTNHRVHWEIIEEEQTEIAIKNNIKNHDDLIKYLLNTYAEAEFRDYAIEYLYKKDNWVGCFGNLTIMDYSFLVKMNNKTNIVYILNNMTSGRFRRASESIFSLACQYSIGDEIHDSYDGLYYDGKNYSNNRKSKHITKRSFNRD